MRRQRRKTGKKLLSLLLTVAILLTMQGISAKVTDAAVENKVFSVFRGPAVITVNRDLYCWGENRYGQVGNGSTENQTTPVKVLKNVVSISMGSTRAAITTNGDLYCWGKNQYGQVGNGSTENQTTPVKVLEDVATVSIEDGSSTAITTNGDLYCWGRNGTGQVGNGSTKNQTTPVKILENIASVSMDDNGNFKAAVTANGNLYCWGSNAEGEVGNGSTKNQTTPVKVLENVDSVSLAGCGFGHCAAIMKNGDLYCWGSNTCGQIGNNSRWGQYTPIKVLENVNSIFLSSGNCAAIMKNGDLYCWGGNSNGEVGSNSLYSFVSTPVKVLENVVSVSMGGTSGTESAAITTNGDLYCWGYNETGQVGNGSTKNQTTPVKILENVVSVSPGNTCAAITTNGDLYCWGKNQYGQVGNGSTKNQTTPAKVLENVVPVSMDCNAVTTDGATTNAVTTDGDLYCWGLNSDGAVGNGTKTDQLIPIKINLPPDNPNIPSTGEIVNQNIIDRVSEYTSDELYAQYDKIANNNYSYETKNKLYQSLFQSYGIIDVREGIRYLSNTTTKRYAYLALTTDDLYCASNFRYWLNNTAKGIAAQAVLVADGLIFNGEINDWLDFTTYLETDFPGVAKYKAMLYDFMDASSDSIEIVSNIKLVSDMAGKTTGAAKLKADNLIEQLNRCSTAAEAEKIMNSSAAMEVWIELAEVKDESGNFVRDNNGSIELTYKLDESSGFGQFSKAMGKATKGISITNMALSDVKDLLTLDSKLAVYTQYSRFLQDIVSDTDGLPFQMRWAAALILTELEEGYFAKIKDIVWEIINQTNLNSVVLKQIIGGTAASSLSSWLSVIGIEAFFINKMADIGEMVKKESAVEGYADLSSAFGKKLERSKQAFLADKTEANAWDFYYNYNILYRLRYKGEEAYLAMTKVKGFLSCFSDFGYAEKEAVVNDTLQMLENRCQFTLDAAQPVPESCQFASKAVINCPVNVSMFAEDGTLIAELLDGAESDVTNEYGRFIVMRDSYSGDYTKIVCLNSEENVSFKITGTDDGLVTMDFAQAKDDVNTVYSFDSVPIEKESVINATTREITEQNTYRIDMNGDGETEEEGTITIKSEDYVPIVSVGLNEAVLNLKKDESSLLKVTLTPVNATNQKLLWMSADPSVAVVADGKVTAVAEGRTIIYCMALDDMDKMVSCEVEVSSEEDTDPAEQPDTSGSGTPGGQPDDSKEEPGKPSTGDSEENPGKPSTGDSEEESGKPSTGDSEEEPGKPSAGNSEKQPGNSSSGNSEGQPGNSLIDIPEGQPGNPPASNSEGQSSNPLSGNSSEQKNTIKTGYMTTANKMKYKVTKVNADGTGEVSLTGSTRKKTDKKYTFLKIADNVTINGKSFKVTAIGKSAFSGYTKLKTVTIGKNITNIGNSAFKKCTALAKIVIPSKVTQIGKQAFSRCKKLKSVTIGKNVVAIGDKAFYQCAVLTKIVIPSKVTKIGKQAFCGCKKLKTITIKTSKLTTSKVGSRAFKGIHAKATVKVPKAKLAVYKKLLRAKGIGYKAKIKK